MGTPAPPRPGLAGRLIDLATSLPVLLIFGALQAGALGVTALRYLLSLRGPLGSNGQVVTGDFMAFFTGASLIRRGQGLSLYDLSVQLRTQGQIAGKELSRWQPYQNPPALALALVPVTGLAYHHAFYVFVAAMVAAMAGSALLLRPALPEAMGARTRCAVTVLVIVGFQPVIRTMVGGQNTVLSLMLLAGLFSSLERGRSARAGLFLGLLSYKPQLGSLATVLLVARGELLTLGVAAAVTAAHYLVAAIPCGWSWPMAMLRQAVEMRSLEWTQNLSMQFSVWAALLTVLPAALAKLVAVAVSLAVALWVGVVARRHAADPASSLLIWGLVVSGTLLISPHLQYYDAGLLVLPALLMVTHLLRRGSGISRGARLALAAGYLGYPLHALGPALRVQPLFFGLLALLVWNAYLLRQRSREAATAGR